MVTLDHLQKLIIKKIAAQKKKKGQFGWRKFWEEQECYFCLWSGLIDVFYNEE